VLDLDAARVAGTLYSAGQIAATLGRAFGMW